MEENSLEEFSDEVREALFDIAEDLLKTDNYKIRVEAGSKKGEPVYCTVSDSWIIKRNRLKNSRRQFHWNCLPHNL